MEMSGELLEGLIATMAIATAFSLIAIVFSFGTYCKGRTIWMWCISAFVSVVMFIVLVFQRGNAIYEVHDCTIQVYYIDGGTDKIKLCSIDSDLPCIRSYRGSYYLVYGRQRIDAVCRYKVIYDSAYKAKGRDINPRACWVN